jgi:MoaA/NifB/PqqE/SkfB family radical SAM enzyme
MILPVTVPPSLQGFFAQLMKGRMVDDNDQIVDMSLALDEIANREENEILAGLIPKDGYKCPLRVQWEFTRTCNLSCVFCYNSRDRLHKDGISRDAAMDVARQIAEMDVLEVVLSGGEVFTDWDLLRSLGRYFTAQNIGIHLITNGWFTTAEHIREIRNWRILSVQVSIDGAGAEAHDELRGQTGSWRRAVSSLRMFSEVGIFTQTACALNQRNCKTLSDYIELCLLLGARRVVIGDLLLLGQFAEICREEYLIDPHTYEECLTGVRKQAASHKHLLDIQFAQDPGLAIAYSLLKRPTALVIRYDGTAIPSCLLAHPIGDLKKESLQMIWDRIKGGLLDSDALVETLAAIEVTQTPDLNLSRTIYAPAAAEVFL